MLENIMLCGYEVPTPIQAYTIPAVLNNFDVIGTAQTGEQQQF
jgi:ATP-dependent RNA helicase DDX3X